MENPNSTNSGQEVNSVRKGSRAQQPSGEELVQIRRRARTILSKEIPSYDCTSLGLTEPRMKLLISMPTGPNNLITLELPSSYTIDHIKQAIWRTVPSLANYNRNDYHFCYNKTRLNVEFIRLTKADKEIEDAVKEERPIPIELVSLSTIVPKKRELKINTVAVSPKRTSRGVDITAMKEALRSSGELNNSPLLSPRVRDTMIKLAESANLTTSPPTSPPTSRVPTSFVSIGFQIPGEKPSKITEAESSDKSDTLSKSTGGKPTPNVDPGMKLSGTEKTATTSPQKTLKEAVVEEKATRSEVSTEPVKNNSDLNKPLEISENDKGLNRSSFLSGRLPKEEKRTTLSEIGRKSQLPGLALETRVLSVTTVSAAVGDVSLWTRVKPASKASREETQAPTRGLDVFVQSEKTRLKKERDQWLAETTDLIERTDGYVRYSNSVSEKPRSRYDFSEARDIIDLDKDFNYYQSTIFEKEHFNWVHDSPNSAIGSMILTITKNPDESGSFPTVVWSSTGEDILALQMAHLKSKSSKKEKLSLLKHLRPNLPINELRLVDDIDFANDLFKLESSQKVKNYKFGILYAREGQTDENDMFANNEMSSTFEEFLNIIGERIVLQGWKHYRGGLDVKANSTGKTSVYTKYSEFEVMFHVSTLLPFYPNDKQQLERKRHLGNDICVVVFMDGRTPYSPKTITSEFNNVFFVIQPFKDSQGNTFYRMEITTKIDVPKFGPPLQEYYTKAEIKDYLLKKLINAERASYYAPVFSTKIQRTRKAMISELIRNWK